MDAVQIQPDIDVQVPTELRLTPGDRLRGQLPSYQTIRYELARRDLHQFMVQGWPAVEPKQFVDGQHLHVICEHLEAVYRGTLRHLVINMPPRHAKSLTSSVFFPAWIWLQDPKYRFLASSYSDGLSIRDSVKCRRLMDSPWYRALKQHCMDRIRGYEDWELRGDQNQKQRYDNTAGGYRIATTVCGATTGEGGDIILVDDAHNVLHTRPTSTELRLDEVMFWWDEVMGTRQNDQEGHYVIIMQRVHERDLVGHIIEKETDGDWTMLNLPARYEGNKVISFVNRPLSKSDKERVSNGEDPEREPSALGTLDWRTHEGEVLWPERLPDVEVKKIEHRLGVFGTAGQMQQRPAPRGGGFFMVHGTPERPEGGFHIIDQRPDPRQIVAMVRYWDKASSETANSSYTAGVLMGLYKNGRFVVLDVVRGRWEKPAREQVIRKTAFLDGKSRMVTWVEQEAGGGGKESAQDTVRNLAGFNVRIERAQINKEVRATNYAVQVENGNVDVLRTSWTMEFIREHEMFPAGRYKDQVDGASGAFNKLAAHIHLKGTW